MKAHISTIALALLVGTLSASAQQEQRGAQTRNKKQRPRCPECGAPRQQGQGNPSFNGHQQPPSQGNRHGKEAANEERNHRQGPKHHQLTPEQRQRRHQKALERFDHDGDGKLSPAERKEAKAMARKAHQRPAPPEATE